MKALTLHEPWATAIALGLKTLETRGWPTHYRGQLAIHASKTINERALIWYASRNVLPGDIKLNPGTIVAVCSLKEVWPTHKLMNRGWYSDPSIPIVTEDEYDLGEFAYGRYGWELNNITALEEPIPIRGYQGLWNVPPEIEEAIKLQMASTS